VNDFRIVPPNSRTYIRTLHPLLSLSVSLSIDDSTSRFVYRLSRVEKRIRRNAELHRANKSFLNGKAARLCKRLSLIQENATSKQSLRLKQRPCARNRKFLSAFSRHSCTSHCNAMRETWSVTFLRLFMFRVSWIFLQSVRSGLLAHISIGFSKSVLVFVNCWMIVKFLKSRSYLVCRLAILRSKYVDSTIRLTVI
jgi:hypothetical protein